MAKQGRREKGTGSLFQRKSTGAFTYELHLGYDEFHTRKRKRFTAKTPEAAEAKAAEYLRRNPYTLQAQNPKLSELLNDWINQHPGKPATIEKYEKLSKVLKASMLGGVRVQEITSERCLTLLAILHKRGKSNHHLNEILIVLKQVFRYAADREILAINPVEKIPLRRVEKRHSVTWTLDEVRTFLSLIKHEPEYLFFLVSFSAGARPAELYGLHWRDINWDRGTISIRQQLLTAKKAKRYFSSPKTKAGLRDIYLPEFVLRALKAESIGATSELVFVNSRGLPFAENTMRKRWHTLVARCKLPPMRLYDIRHTNATLLLAAGENVKIVSERLGHASASITLDTYVHTSNAHQAATALRIANLLSL